MSTPASRQESYYAGIRMVPYDLVKELALALIGTLVLMVVLAAVLSSPDIRPVTIQSWAQAQPVDFVTTATGELAGTTTSSTYGPPYNGGSDSVQGLGFFRPLFRPGVDVHLWGPASPVQSLADRIAIYLSPPLFPVRLADIPARLIFHDEPEDAVNIGSAIIRAAKVTHQGPTVGYRIEENGQSLVYLPDHEPSLGVELVDRAPDWISGFDLARRADVLFHDAQYGDDEYPRHVGWGHSCIEHVMGFATKAEAGTVVLFHHDPYHSDEELEALLEQARALWPSEVERVCLAREGMTIDLVGGVVRWSA